MFEQTIHPSPKSRSHNYLKRNGRGAFTFKEIWNKSCNVKILKEGNSETQKSSPSYSASALTFKEYSERGIRM